jgi:hypothetical protein
MEFKNCVLRSCIICALQQTLLDDHMKEDEVCRMRLERKTFKSLSQFLTEREHLGDEGLCLTVDLIRK